MFSSFRGILRTPFAVVRSVGAIGLLCLMSIYGIKCTPDPPIRSDGAGYYAYLPALVIDHDVGMGGIVARGVAPHGIAPYGAGDANLDKYPVGVAVMMSPFFLLAHGITRALGGRADGFSFVYQAMAALSGLVYGWLGLVALCRTLERHFDPRITALTLVGVVFGTNLFHYFTWESLYSHAYSFCLIAVLVDRVPRWHANPTILESLALGIVAGLIVTVRPTNACVLLYVPLYGLDGWKRWAGRFPFMALMAIAAAGVFTLQLAYWHAVTSHWLVYAYRGEHFQFLSPKPVHVLLSFKKGLFVWAPILVLSVMGLWQARNGKLRAEFVGASVVLVLQLWLVSSWWCWWYGVSLGHRAFTEFVPFFALGLGAFLERGLAPPWPSHRRILRAYEACVAYGIVMMALYWVGILPFDGPNWGPLL